MQKIDCAKYADEILESVKAVPNKKELVIFTAGNDPASASYMRGKLKDGEKCGVPVSVVKVESQQELISRIRLANKADNVGGIIVQLPLPKGFNADEACRAIYLDKDVDGFQPDSKFVPCTPEGIMHILIREGVLIPGKSVLLIGKGKLVGKPLIDLLLGCGMTLTIAHSQTENLDRLLMTHHDVVITAVGKPKLVDLRVTNADVVIDAGINRDENGKLCGDCYGFNELDSRSIRVTTVPGGVGLMTRAMLMKHIGEASE